MCIGHPNRFHRSVGKLVENAGGISDYSKGGATGGCTWPVLRNGQADTGIHLILLTFESLNPITRHLKRVSG